jgi:peptide/nickel transport system permease protein
MLVGAVFGPFIWTTSATHVDLGATLLAPSGTHPMGTDDLGRDLLARFLSGARLSLFLGLVVTVTGAFFGGVLGLVAGMAGRWLDGVMSWLINTALAFPALLMAMAVSVALGADLLSGGIGLVMAAVPWFARVLRSEVVRIRSLPAYEAATVLGAGRLRIAARHVLPHLLPTLVIQAAASFSWVILTLAALGFVGLGAQPPAAEWGSMINGGLQYALSGQWWIGIFPGVGLVVVVTAATVVADRVRDILDPRGSYVRG